MGISTSLSRFKDYYARHGVWATIRRTSVAVVRVLFSSRSVLFYCDLPKLAVLPRSLPDSLKVERKASQAELSPLELEVMTSFWNPKLARHNMEQRFHKGASLWLVKSHDRLAGFGWTLKGDTIEPHYFPLGSDDVQFLDFHVFPEFRGRAIDWYLMTQILHTLAAEGVARAFGEAGEWNKASLASFKMSSFHRMGLARKWTLLGWTIVSWSKGEP